MMRLISCYIENFGTLQKYSVDFNQGLTVIKEENGFGKTTLAAFIKAMLYGLPQTAKRSISENERKRYTPWQSGAFGGTLDIEVNDKKYRIERFFAAKEKDDVFKVIDLATGSYTSEFSETPGLDLFSIDADSFERSIYLPQSDVGVTMSNSLRTKLTGLVENSDDLSNYDNAVKSLEKRAKYYSVGNGARGVIAQKSNEIETLQSAKNDADAAEQNYRRIALEIAVLEKSEAELRLKDKQLQSRIIVASDAAAREIEAKQYEELLNKVNELSEEKDKLQARYQAGLPSDMGAVGQKINQYNEAVTELELLDSDTFDQDELAALEQYFNGVVPTEDDIKSKRSLLNAAELDSLKVDSLKETAESIYDTKKGGAGFSKTALLVGAAVIALGITTTFIELIVGVILLVVGLVTLGVAGFFNLKGMIGSNAPKEDSLRLKHEYERCKISAKEKREIVSDFVGKYTENADLSVALDEILRNINAYERVKSAVKKRNDRYEMRRETAERLKAELSVFFTKYGQYRENSFLDRYNAVNNDIIRVNEVSARLKEAKDRLSAIPKPERIETSVFDDDREVLIEQKNENDAKLNEIAGQIYRLKQDRDTFAALSVALPEIEESLENSVRERKEMTERYEVITATLELLQKAKTVLSEKYLDKMIQGFCKYSKILTGLDVPKTVIDTDLNVRLDQNGASREMDYFSAGFRDMSDIALRLSLSDALFEGEKPMLILDDPFVNMDDKRVENAMEMLKKLSEQRQIVYLTCHSSRC